ncbi:MAG TPA: Uma2 family endonuclease [Candidatus Tectomicrobia bacterium]|nr:Uma2 family endonuclease [Candidatus Tectomicrobia bacterium]
MAIEVEVRRRLFTVEEYHRMAEAGIFHPDERLELIEGEIVRMAPIGPRHAGCVINATRLFVTRFADRAIVSPQNPVVIQPRSEPQPDLLVLRPRAVSYSREHPTPDDVLLAVEVAETTVRFDRLVKARLYARARIPEFWLLLPPDGAVEVYRGPTADGYASAEVRSSRETVSPLAFPDAAFGVADFFV